MRFRDWTIRALALGVLAGAVALARGAKHEGDALSVAFDAYLADVGTWTCVEAGEPEAIAAGAVLKQARQYRGPRGQEVPATFVVTATRLGGLRDYSVALEAQGWVRGNQDVLAGPPIASLGEPMRFRVEQLYRGETQRLALTWFVSSRRQAHDLAGAEFGGWTDLIFQRHAPVWAEVYATVEVGDEASAARERLVDFAHAVGPAVAQLAQEESRRLATGA